MNVKSGSAASGRKQYVFFDQLCFLAVLQDIRPVSDRQPDIGREGDAAEEIIPPKKQKKNVSNTEKAENELLKRLSDNLTKKKRHYDDNDDPDRNFLVSLVPDLKSIHDDLKLDIKADIIQLFRRYKTYRPIQSYPPQPAYYGCSTQAHDRDYDEWGPTPGPSRDYRLRNVSIQGSTSQRNTLTTLESSQPPTTTIVPTTSPASSSVLSTTDSSTLEEMFNDDIVPSE